MSPDNFHALTRAERDHLLAAATFEPSLKPSGMDINRRVDQLRAGETPSKNTTYAMLDQLVEWGLLSKETIDGKTTAYDVTTDGHALLSQAKRLFPA